MIQSLMKINLLKKVWKFLDQLGTQTKTIIIIGLLGWCLGNYIISENKNSIKYCVEQLESERQEAEQYTLKMAPEIDRCVQAILDKDIEELIQKRADAKKNKDFKLADEIRQELLDKGIVLEDTRQGTKWKRV